MLDSQFFQVGEDLVAQFNTATNNEEAGFVLLGSGHQFRNNLAVGNRGAGILVFEIDEFPTRKIEVHANNIFGNLSLGGDNSEAGCGLINGSQFEIDARNNYWGAASGPGSDPADKAGGICDRQPNSVTIVQPFALEPFPVSP